MDDAPNVSQEYLDFMAAQDAIRAWLKEFPGSDVPIPQFLLNRLKETQAKYEESRRNEPAA